MDTADRATQSIIARAALLAAAGISMLVGAGFYAAHLAQPQEQVVCVDIDTLQVVDPKYCGH